MIGRVSSEHDEAVAGCRAAHRRLFATIRSIDEATVRQPSRLPGWTVGHLLTHLARNADSHVRMLLAAERGESVEQYAGGADQRAADIEAGAGRPRDALVTDVGQSAIDLEAVWETTSAAGWAGHGLRRGVPGRASSSRSSGGGRWRCTTSTSVLVTRPPAGRRSTWRESCPSLSPGFPSALPTSLSAASCWPGCSTEVPSRALDIDPWQY